MKRFNFPVTVSELPGGTFVAFSPILEGCHAEGRTPMEAVEHLEDIAKGFLEMKSPYAVLAHPHMSFLGVLRNCSFI